MRVEIASASEQTSSEWCASLSVDGLVPISRACRCVGGMEKKTAKPTARKAHEV